MSNASASVAFPRPDKGPTHLNRIRFGAQLHLDLSSAWLDAQTLAPFLNETVVGKLNHVVGGSPATRKAVDMSNVEDVITVPKTEHSDDASFSESSPEADEQSFIRENTQVQKRKGGRKPV